MLLKTREDLIRVIRELDDSEAWAIYGFALGMKAERKKLSGDREIVSKGKSKFEVKEERKMETRKKFLSFYYETAGELPEIVVNPKKTALLIVDLQNEFVLRDFGEAVEFKKNGEWERWIPFHDRLDEIVIPNNVKLLNFFRENKMTVTFGRIACLREDGEDRSPVQKSEGWNNMLMPVGGFAAQMIEELTPLENEIVVNKTTDSVTTGTNYLTLLRFMGIETVVVTGIVTDQCVASTVRGLADDGFKVICVEDACAAGSMELHNAELTIMNSIYCDVMSTEETIDIIEKNL